MIDFDTVRRIAFDLPEVEDGMSYGAPALKRKGKLLVRLREDLDAIVILTTFDVREGLMADDPATYFITDHYTNYPYVLARFEHLTEEAARELVSSAWRFAGAKGQAKRK